VGRRVVDRLGLVGVAKLDFKRAPDGSLRLLEVNPRFTLWHHPAARAGVNIPALVYADLVGRPRPPVSKVRPGVRWSDLRRDIPAVGRSPRALIRWVPWFVRVEAKSWIAWHDPMPLLRGMLWRHLRRRLRR
jgi:D-aspartate ligase